MADRFQTILKRLENNDPTLTGLTLNSTKTHKVGNPEAVALAKALKSNTHLKSLIFNTWSRDFCYVGDTGAIALAGMLKTNKGLRNLDLSYNKVGDAGARAFSKALNTNTTLYELHLLNNFQHPVRNFLRSHGIVGWLALPLVPLYFVGKMLTSHPFEHRAYVSQHYIADIEASLKQHRPANWHKVRHNVISSENSQASSGYNQATELLGGPTAVPMTEGDDAEETQGLLGGGGALPPVDDTSTLHAGETDTWEIQDLKGASGLAAT